MNAHLTHSKDFLFPVKSNARFALKASLLLYKKFQSYRFAPHIGACAIYIKKYQSKKTSPIPKCEKKILIDEIVELIRNADEKISFNSRKKEKQWLLVVGLAHRNHDMRLMKNITKNLLIKKANIIYISYSWYHDYHHFKKYFKQSILKEQLYVVDPIEILLSISRKPNVSKMLAKAQVEWCISSKILGNSYLKFDQHTFKDFIWIELLKMSWKALKNQLHFSSLITRNNWLPLGAIISQDFLKKGIPVLTHQHSVVGTPVSYVPVLANYYVAFGQHSIELIERYHKKICKAVGLVPHKINFVQGGCFLDPNFIKTRTSKPKSIDPFNILFIDQYSSWSTDYYGLHHHLDLMSNLLEELVIRFKKLNEIKIRIHPDGEGFSYWKSISKKYPGKINLVSSKRSLFNQVSNSTIIIGFFSTALVTAMLAGRPTFFLNESGKFWTKDLDFLDPGLLLDQKKLFLLIKRFSSNLRLYNKYCDKTLRSVRKYYSQLPLSYSGKQSTQ